MVSLGDLNVDRRRPTLEKLCFLSRNERGVAERKRAPNAGTKSNKRKINK